MTRFSVLTKASNPWTTTLAGPSFVPELKLAWAGAAWRGGVKESNSDKTLVQETAPLASIDLKDHARLYLLCAALQGISLPNKKPLNEIGRFHFCSRQASKLFAACSSGDAQQPGARPPPSNSSHSKHARSVLLRITVLVACISCRQASGMSVPFPHSAMAHPHSTLSSRGT